MSLENPLKNFMLTVEATWVLIFYVFFPESKGRELEDFNCLFAGEEDAAITERIVESSSSGKDSAT